MTACHRTKGARRPTGARARRLLGAALLGFALVSLAPRPARADAFADEFREFMLIITFGGVFAIVDTVFLVHDAVVAARGEHPSTGFSIAEVVVMAPQAALMNASAASNMVDRRPKYGWIFPSLLTSAMLTHGIWSLSTTPEKPTARTRFLASGAIGINATLTVSAIASLFGDRHLYDIRMGIAEVSLTLPQVSFGAIALGLYPEDRPGWAGFTAWSGVLLAHGLLSIALDDDERNPRPVLIEEGPPGALRPRILGFGPAPIGGIEGHAPGMGFVLRGSM